MPHQIKYFVMENNPAKFADFLSQLAALGINYTERYIELYLHDVKNKDKFRESLLRRVTTIPTYVTESINLLYFNLEGTELIAETNESPDTLLESSAFVYTNTKRESPTFEWINKDGSHDVSLQDREIGPPLRSYKLKYRDIEICETSVKFAFFSIFGWRPGYVKSFARTVYGVPNQLRQSAVLADRKPQQDIMFLIGKSKPSSLDMQHLSFLGITAANLVMSDGRYYFRLPYSKEFTTLTIYEPRRKTHELQHKGIVIIARYEFHSDNSSTLWIYPRQIGAATNYRNLMNLPRVIYSDYTPGRGNVSEVDMLNCGTLSNVAVGTIAGCINGIEKDEYDGFEIEAYPVGNPDTFDSESFQSKNIIDAAAYSEQEKARLLAALRKNTSLKMIEFSRVKITREDFTALLDIVSKKPNTPLLHFVHCRFDITSVELLKILSKVTRSKLQVHTDCSTSDNIKLTTILNAHIEESKPISATSIDSQSVTRSADPTPETKEASQKSHLMSGFYGIYIFNSRAWNPQALQQQAVQYDMRDRNQEFYQETANRLS